MPTNPICVGGSTGSLAFSAQGGSGRGFTFWVFNMISKYY